MHFVFSLITCIYTHKKRKQQKIYIPDAQLACICTEKYSIKFLSKYVLKRANRNFVASTIAYANVIHVNFGCFRVFFVVVHFRFSTCYLLDEKRKISLSHIAVSMVVGAYDNCE